jgi:tetratricopeptide (TPR) repeat protein
MAKRRFNTKFLVIFTVILVGGVVAMVSAKTLLSRGGNAEKLIKMGDAAVKEAALQQSPDLKKEKLEVALRNYSQASQSVSKDPSIWLKVGDTYNQLTRFDFRTNILAARASWEKALEINPGFLEALRRLQDSYYQELSLSRGSLAVFKNLRERSEKIHKLDPNDLRAASLRHIATLHQWLSNIETDATEIETAINELTELMPKDPSNADSVFYVAAAKGKRAAEAKRNSQDKVADDLFKESVATFEAALKTQADNAQMHYRYFVLLQVVRSENRLMDGRYGYSKMIDDAIKKVRETAKPTDPKYVEMLIAVQQYEQGRNRRDDAERILRDMMANSELAKDQRVRLALAKLYRYDRDPNKRAEALRILSEPMVDIGWIGPEAWRRVGLEIETLIERANMNIDKFAQTSSAERPALLKEIEQTYDQAVNTMVRANQPGEDSRLLKIRGKIELLRGGGDAAIRAIQTFEKAQAQFRIDNNNREDLDLMFLLARAYYASRQTGQARQILVRFVDKVPDYIQARVMLAELLIAEGEPGLAKSHVEYLEKNAPDLPDVVRLVLQTIEGDKPDQKARVKSYFDKLPEDKLVEQVAKAGVASKPPVSNVDEALRLYKKALAAKPGDFEIIDAARSVLVQAGRNDDAIKLLQEGLKASPNEERFTLLLAQLNGATPDDIKKASREVIKKTHADDPFALELKLYEFERLASGNAEALKHLEAAEKLKPDDGRVLDQMFRHFVDQQDWVKAQAYVEKLAKINWDQANGLVYRFRLAMTRNDIPLARRYADEMTQSLREFARSWVFSAQSKQAAGDFEHAISDYQVALERQSGNQDALLGIIACCYQLKRFPDAGRYIEKGMELHPSDVRFKQLNRDFQMAYGDPTKIFVEAKAERDANPKDVQKWIALGRAYYAAARNKAADASAAKNLDESRKVFAEALKQFPGERLIWAHLVELAEYNKNLAAAEAILKDMASRPEFKDSPDPILMLGDFFARTGDSDKAEAAYKQAVETFKDKVEIKRKLAAFYTQKKDWPAALKLLDPASPDKNVRQQIVEIYMLAGQFPEAEKLLRGLLQTETRDAQLHALLGVVLLNQGKREQALEAMNTSLDLDPRNTSSLYSRSQLRLTSKPPQLDEAIRDLQALRDLVPTHVEARVSLADAYKRKYRTTEAAREYEAALSLVPSRRDIRMALLDLYSRGRNPSWGDAERLLNDAIAAEPKEVAWRRVQAKMYSLRGKHEDAIKAAYAAIVVEPTNSGLVQDYLEVLQAGKYWPQLFAESNRLINENESLAKTGWWVYVKRGTARRYMDQKAEAMDDFMKAFDITSKLDTGGGISAMQIQVVEQMAEHIAKDEAIRRAEALANKDVRWKVVLAFLYHSNENPTRATELIDEVRLQLADLKERDKMTTLSMAGSIFMLNHQYDRAQGVYEDILKISPDDLAALNNIAALRAEFTSNADPKKALEISTRTYNLMLNRNMSDPNILDTHGWVHVLCGGQNVDVGIEYLSDSIKAADLPEAHYHLGEAMLRKNMPDDALKSLQRADEILRERQGKKQVVDSKLRERIDEALARADKAKSEAKVTQQ